MVRLIKNMKIQIQIIFLYFLALILSFLLTFSAISVINKKYTEQEVGAAGMQTIEAINLNLNLILENVRQFSDLIYFDSNVQEALRQIDSSSINPVIQQTIQKSLVRMILSGEYISTANIFDIYYNDYNSYKIGPIIAEGEKIEDTGWYQKMKDAEGGSFFIHKSESVLSFPTRKEKNYISLVREICDQETYERLAILMLTIDEETLQSYFREVSGPYKSSFFIVDKAGNYIITPEEMTHDWKQYIPGERTGDSGYETVTVNGRKMICVYQNMGVEDWILIGMMPMNEVGIQSSFPSYLVILIAGLNLIFMFLCSIMLSKLIFSPLAKVVKHMKLVEQGSFSRMEVDGRQNEINTLKSGFNQMMGAIEQLILQVKEEEKIILKNELDIIQAQINPHFLYNTLDAVSALALINDNESCFKMTQALGSFYRNSLNSGKDIVSVKDEIACIKSYITILNIRYDDKIMVTYDVEEKIMSMQMLKLILQPVVENAVHHGIQEKGNGGQITIKGYQDEDELIFIVTDDGCGMDEERIEAIMRGETQTGKNGFGLYSLIQRVSLYYQIDNPVMIHSEVGSGTEVTIRIGVLDGEGA